MTVCWLCDTDSTILTTDTSIASKTADTKQVLCKAHHIQQFKPCIHGASFACMLCHRMMVRLGIIASMPNYNDMSHAEYECWQKTSLNYCAEILKQNTTAKRALLLRAGYITPKARLIREKLLSLAKIYHQKRYAVTSCKTCRRGYIEPVPECLS